MYLLHELIWHLKDLLKRRVRDSILGTRYHILDLVGSGMTCFES